MYLDAKTIVIIKQSTEDTWHSNKKISKQTNKNKSVHWGAWLAELVECETRDLGVASSSPTLGVEII